MATTAVRTNRIPSLRRYEFRDAIGVGGSGTVYRAYDRLARTLVAIKVLDAKLSEKPTMHRRLAVEFQAASALEHPNIVRALACDNDGETSYLVYELIDGESLGDRLEKSGGIPFDESVRILTQVTQALHYAHERHIVHRDVKPDNILMTADGRAKLTDFGLAKDFGADGQDLTKPASALGTPHFMAPEQFADAKSVDRRCDVYSLAATFYNMLTGELPFNAKTPLAILSNKELKRLTPLRSLVPGIGEQVDHAVMKGLDPNPEGRPGSCLEFFKCVMSRSSECGSVPKPAPAFEGVERRAAIRFEMRVGSCAIVDSHAHGGGEMEECWPMIVRDISRGGMQVVLARRFEPGTDFQIDAVAGPGGVSERLSARVVRVRAEGAGQWIHGCAFSSPLPNEQLDALLRFM